MVEGQLTPDMLSLHAIEMDLRKEAQGPLGLCERSENEEDRACFGLWRYHGPGQGQRDQDGSREIRAGEFRIKIRADARS